MIISLLLLVSFVITVIHSNPMDYSYINPYRTIRSPIGIIPIPPPLLQPPPISSVCNIDCGSDGLKALMTDPCRCECVLAVEAPCETPVLKESTKKTKKTKKSEKTKKTKSEKTKKTKSKVKRRKSKSKTKSYHYHGCPELTPKGRRYKKPRRHRHSHTHTHSHNHFNATALECPTGQVLNATTCYCMMTM